MGIILKSNLNTNLKFGTYIANMFDNVGVKFQKFWFSSFLVIEQSSRLSVQPSYILDSVVFSFLLCHHIVRSLESIKRNNK